MAESIYKIEISKISNTDKFRPAALHYEKYGSYINVAKGTSAYFEYWDEEINRCLNGYEVDGDRITGYHYFYLNYCPIMRTVPGKKGKYLAFPRYYDYDREFFLIIDKCELLGKHLVVLKARRKGYSYKIAAMQARNYYLIPGSKSYSYAAETEFLTKDGILSKAWEYLDFIDEHTAWYKKRQKVDTKMHKRASFVVDNEGVKVELGYKSEIIGVTLKNDVQKIRGKAAKLIVFEEAGTFPQLKTAWQIARPSVEQGNSVFGLMIAFGTGGTEGSDFEGLKDLFYEPDAYNCLTIENIWDEGSIKPCGFFVPDYYNLSDEFMDEDGNSLTKEAIEFSMKEREKITNNATDRTAVDRYIAEHCFTPHEATLQISSNIFPKAELIKHLAFIRNNKSIYGLKQAGNLVYDNDGLLNWVPSTKPRDITTYRIPTGTNVNGEIAIWEHPVEDAPHGMYIAACDSYDHDKSNTNSLGSIFIYKRFQGFDNTYDIIVAEYTGRPEKADIFYENVHKLLKYYNAKLLYENQNPGIAAYFRTNHIDFMLADQPDIINKIIKDSKVSRTKGVHMTKEIKLYAEGKWRDWLITKRSDGKLNLNTILSEPLLEELIAYNDNGNFDRCSAVFILAIYMEELYNIAVKERNQEATYSNQLFPKGIFIEEETYSLSYGI